MAEPLYVLCPVCDGRRWIWSEVAHHYDEPHPACERCEGKGVVPATPEQIVEAANELRSAAFERAKDEIAKLFDIPPEFKKTKGHTRG